MPPINLRLTAIALIAFIIVFLATAPAYVDAGSTYDGTYDYSYSFNGPNGPESHSVPSGLIVAWGKISSNPAALSGSVDAAGNVQFTGPCPQGGNAVFTGTLYADGTGAGAYQGPSGAGGIWSVIRVSGTGGYSGSGDSFDTLFNFFYDVGTVVGAPDELAEVAGLMVTMVAASALLIGAASIGAWRRKQQGIAGSRKARASRGASEKRERGYAVAPAGAPVQSTEMPPPISIGADSHRMEAIGEVRAGTSAAPGLNLRAAWTKDQVTLSWSKPDFDTGAYRLDGFEVSVLQHGPGSTAPARMPVARLSPEVIQWMGPYRQTSRFSTGGDINGYVVEALLSRVTGTGHNEIIRLGATALAPAL